jgi:hypothetical protein
VCHHGGSALDELLAEAADLVDEPLVLLLLLLVAGVAVEEQQVFLVSEVALDVSLQPPKDLLQPAAVPRLQAIDPVQDLQDLAAKEPKVSREGGQPELSILQLPA